MHFRMYIVPNSPSVRFLVYLCPIAWEFRNFLFNFKKNILYEYSVIQCLAVRLREAAPGPSGKSGFVKQGGGSPDEAKLDQTPYPFQPH